MVKILLSENEKQILKNYFKTTPLIVIRLKAQAILMKDRAIQVVDIAAVLSRNERTVRRWIKDFSEKRLGSLFTGHSDNENASKLTREQKEESRKYCHRSHQSMDYPRSFGMCHN